MITAAELRKYVGKTLEWEYAHDKHRGTCLVRKGTLEEVKARNLLIDGEWRWWPDLINLVVL